MKTEDEVLQRQFNSIESNCKISLSKAQRQFFQPFFKKIYNLRDRIDRREALALFTIFKQKLKTLIKTERGTGGGPEEGKYWEKRRAECVVMFWACFTSGVLLQDRCECRFPLLSTAELLEIFPEFRSISYDTAEIKLLCKYHQSLAAVMQVIDPVGKKGVSMKVAGRIESGVLYVTGGGASMETKRREVIYDRLCADGHVYTPMPPVSPPMLESKIKIEPKIEASSPLTVPADDVSPPTSDEDEESAVSVLGRRFSSNDGSSLNGDGDVKGPSILFTSPHWKRPKCESQESWALFDAAFDDLCNDELSSSISTSEDLTDDEDEMVMQDWSSSVCLKEAVMFWGECWDNE
jgi:hypothetical protein